MCCTVLSSQYEQDILSNFKVCIVKVKEKELALNYSEEYRENHQCPFKWSREHNNNGKIPPLEEGLLEWVRPFIEGKDLAFFYPS